MPLVGAALLAGLIAVAASLPPAAQLRRLPDWRSVRRRNAAILAEVDKTDFPRRSIGLSREIQQKKPDLIGLQEVAWWRTNPTPGAPALRHRVFREIGEELRPNDLLVVNDSRVIPARLAARRDTGGEAEILALRPTDDGSGRWEGLVRPSRRVGIGDRLTLRSGDIVEVGERLGHVVVALGQHVLAELVHRGLLHPLALLGGGRGPADTGRPGPDRAGGQPVPQAGQRARLGGFFVVTLLARW